MFQIIANAIMSVLRFTALASVTSIMAGLVALAVLFTLLFAPPLKRLKSPPTLPRGPVRNTRALLRR